MQILKMWHLNYLYYMYYLNISTTIQHPCFAFLLFKCEPVHELINVLTPPHNGFFNNICHMPIPICFEELLNTPLATLTPILRSVWEGFATLHKWSTWMGGAKPSFKFYPIGLPTFRHLADSRIAWLASRVAWPVLCTLSIWWHF